MLQLFSKSAFALSVNGLIGIEKGSYFLSFNKTTFLSLCCFVSVILSLHSNPTSVHIISSFKMADSEDDEGVSSRVFDYSTLFDDGIGEILERLDGEDKADVMDELIDGYDMPALMNMRMKIFRFAKCKLMKSLEEPGPGDLDEAYAGFVLHERIEDARKMVDEWTLIARRGKNRVVQDSLTLLSYLSGDLTLFPHAVLRRRPKKKTRRGKKKNTPKQPSSKDPKQPLIPFTAGASNDESVGPSTNDTDSDSDVSSTGSSDVFNDDDMEADADDNYQSAPGGCGDDAVTSTMCEGTQVGTSPATKQMTSPQ